MIEPVTVNPFVIIAFPITPKVAPRVAGLVPILKPNPEFTFANNPPPAIKPKPTVFEIQFKEVYPLIELSIRIPPSPEALALNK